MILRPPSVHLGAAPHSPPVTAQHMAGLLVHQEPSTDLVGRLQAVQQVALEGLQPCQLPAELVHRLRQRCPLGVRPGLGLCVLLDLQARQARLVEAKPLQLPGELPRNIQGIGDLVIDTALCTMLQCSQHAPHVTLLCSERQAHGLTRVTDGRPQP